MEFRTFRYLQLQRSSNLRLFLISLSVLLVAYRYYLFTLPHWTSNRTVKKVLLSKLPAVYKIITVVYFIKFLLFKLILSVGTTTKLQRGIAFALGTMLQDSEHDTQNPIISAAAIYSGRKSIFLARSTAYIHLHCRERERTFFKT